MDEALVYSGSNNFVAASSGRGDYAASMILLKIRPKPALLSGYSLDQTALAECCCLPPLPLNHATASYCIGNIKDRR